MATDYSFAGAPVKGRNPWGVIALGFITLGIYLIYWWYQVNREMRDSTQRRVDVEPWMSVLAVTLGALVIVPAFVSFHNTGRRAQATADIAGARERLNMWIYWGLLIVSSSWGAYVYLQWTLNRCWDAMAEGGASVVDPPAAAAPAASSGPFVGG